MFESEYLKDIILKSISEEDLFRLYIPQFKQIGKKFMAVGRDEKIPSAVISYYNGKLIYKDFGSSLPAMDVFTFLKTYYNLSYYDIINNNLSNNLNIIGSKTKKEDNTIYTTNFKYSFKLRKYLAKDKKFWSEFGVNDKNILVKFNVFPVEFVDVYKKETIRICYDLMYVYIFNDSTVKFYSPFAKNGNKFFGNSNKNTIQGYSQLPNDGDLLIITKSLKDVISLYVLGYNSIAPNSESVLISENTINELKERFKNIILLFDNDRQGKESSKKYKEIYGIDSVFIDPKYSKDVSDFIKMHGLDKCKEYLKTLI